MDETKAISEMYLGAEIPKELYDTALNAAAGKLDRIISREGDLNGERKLTHYLAQLVAEETRVYVFSQWCEMDYDGKKKSRPHNGQPLKPPSL